MNGTDGGISFANFVTDTIVTRDDLQFLAGSGVGVQYMQSSYGVHAVIDNCTMDSNAGYVGANLYMAIWDFVDNSTILVKNSTVINGFNPQLTYIDVFESSLGSGFYFEYGILPIDAYDLVCEVDRKYEMLVLTMEDCLVAYNTGLLSLAAIVELPKSFYDHPREVILKGVQFVENNGDATLVLQGQGLIPSGFKTYLIECEFVRNYFQIPSNVIIGSSNHQIVYQISMLYAEYINCTWRDNQESSLHAIQSRLIMTGENTFINNTGVNGGGLEIQEGSEVFLQSGSKTVFVNNYAHRFGGAIYALMLSYRCFFQLDTSKELPVLSFNNNTAVLAGDAVYGNLRRCLFQHDSSSNEPLNIFNEMSFFQFISQNSSIVSGDPIILCSCNDDDVVNCSSSVYNSESYYDVYSSPGKEFTVKLIAYAFYDGVTVGGQTTARIVATVIKTDNDSINANVSLKSAEPNERTIQKGCSEVSLAVTGPESQPVYLTLSPSSNRLYFPAFVRVHLEKCPNGFVYSSNERSCVCAPLFVDNRIDCNLHTNEFTKADYQWIGYVESGNESIIAVGSCRRIEYCRDTTTVTLGDTIPINNDYSQCANHRSGTLCGQCQPGYSLALGSSNCLECSNSSFALLIFFVLAGPLWIVFLSFFDLTVSTGRINGMLFYANVLRIANFEFFNHTENPAFYIFQIIINWINLDFGIVSCFYDGFDYYAKAWFNFAFPLYLFIILATITICAHRFSKFSHILPRNILSVLTTVILICFTKLLRSSFDPITYHRLDTDQSGTVIVWYFDGSLKYFGLKHSILLVFALFVLLLLVVPFAVVIMSYPYLQSFTAHEDTIFERFICFLRTKIIFKFKPLLETYDGPFFSNHRYYVGLQVVIRLAILFLAVGSYTATTNDDTGVWFKPVSVSAICLIMFILVISKRVYLCKNNTFVELLHLGNLFVLEFVLLVLQFAGVDNNHQGIAVSLSITLSFGVFVFFLTIEMYFKLAPLICKQYFGSDHKSNLQIRIQNRQVEENEKTMKLLDTDHQTNQIIDLIDDDRLKVKGRTKRGLNRFQEQENIIQNLINRDK